MKKLMTITMAGVAALATFAETYDASTGYVTLKQGDSWGAGSWAAAGNWSDGQAPHPGTNYYVRSGLSLICQGTSNAFAGDSLVVAGSILNNGAWAYRFGNLILLPGAKIDQYYNSWSLNMNQVAGETLTIRGTEANPVEWLFDTGNVDYGVMYLNTQLYSDETGYMKFSKTASAANPSYAFGGSSLSTFSGKLEISDGVTFNVNNTSTPGGYVASRGGRITSGDSSAGYNVGTLGVKAGGILNLSGSRNFIVGRKLELESGAVVETTFGGSVSYGTPEKRLMFTLAPEAVEAGLPDFESVDYRLSGSGSTWGSLPRLTNVVEVAADGSAKVYRTYRECVHKNNRDGWQNSSVNPTFVANNPDAWSNGVYPEAGKDYYTEYNLVVYGTPQPFVFPGEVLCMQGQYAKINIWETDRDVTFKQLDLSQGASIGTMGRGATIKLRGKITSFADSTTANAFNVGDGNTLEILADINGSGNVSVRYSHTADSAWYNDLNYAYGVLALSGDNSGFTGKLSVIPDDPIVYNASTKIPLSAEHDITVRVSSGAALGGPLAEAAYDGFRLANQCRLTVTDDAEFSETTRGWYFPGTAYLNVADGKTAKVRSTLTAGGEIVKEADGVVLFAAIVPEAENGAAKVTVESGSVGACATTAFDGVPLDFATGAGLAVEAHPADQTFAAKGFTYTDVSKLTSAGTITVTITGVADWAEDFVPFTVGICTVPTAQAATLAGKMRAKKPAKGIGAKIVTIDNGDGTTTIAANCDRFGMVLLVR